MPVKPLLCVVVFLTATFGQARSDYFILANPLNYTIYNEYGQPLTDLDRSEFIPHTPLRLLAADFMLGDQITRSCKVSLNDRTYFLLKDDRGGFIGEKGKGARLVVHNAQAVDDTIEVTAGGAVSVMPVAGQAHRINAGVRIIRVFLARGRYYVKTGDGSPFYGWSSLEPRSAWHRIQAVVAPAAKPAARAITADTVIPGLLKQRIIDKVGRANAAYQDIFAHFNAATGGGKIAPHWSFDSSSTQLRFVFSQHYTENDELAGSTKELRSEIENLLPGTGFRLTGKAGEMVFKRIGKK